MPKFPNIPRLTIVVPCFGKTDVFENSLASVLQHRPEDCEILVPHAGDYNDPFDLSDEVTFVNAGSSKLMHQIAESAERARGRFVHVIADGFLATSDWADAALAEFEFHETGWVAPVVRLSDHADIVHAGWTQSARSACDFVASGQMDVTPKDARSIDGGFLAASFWRRDLLRSLSGSFLGDDIIEASVVYSRSAQQAGWRGVVAHHSDMLACNLETTSSDTDYATRIQGNQRCLQAISDHFCGGGWGKTLTRLISVAPRGGIGRAIQRATAPLAAGLVSRQIRRKDVLRSDEPSATLRISPNASSLGSDFESRRAA